MRLRFTVERGLIVTSGLVIISLQLAILWTDRRSAAVQRSLSQAQSIVEAHEQHQQPQSQQVEAKDDGDDDVDESAPDTDKAAGSDAADADAAGDDDAEDDKDDQGTEDAELPANEETKGMWPNQTAGLLPNESSEAAARRKHVESECQRRGLTSKEWPRIPATMLVSDKFKVMYCMIGKVASSTWKKVFLMATGKIDPSHADDFQHRSVGARALRVLQPMNSKHSSRNRQRLGSYFKFVFVRHPLDRLLSAFREKFRLNPDYMRAYGRRIIRRYRANATAESLERGHDVNLDEFVRFMVDMGLRFRKDVHWTAQYDLCQPCAISYDFIGHYETLWSDGDYVLRRLGIKSDVKFPRWSRNHTDSQQHYEEAFSGVRPEHMKRLRQLYSRDYDFFGYS